MDAKLYNFKDVPDNYIEEIEKMSPEIVEAIFKISNFKHQTIILNALNLAYTDILSYFYKDRGEDFLAYCLLHIEAIVLRLKSIHEGILKKHKEIE